MNDGGNLLESEPHGSLLPETFLACDISRFRSCVFEAFAVVRSCGVIWQLATNVSGQLLAVIFNGKAVKTAPKLRLTAASLCRVTSQKSEDLISYLSVDSNTA
jgi:hypothetical protein